MLRRPSPTYLATLAVACGLATPAAPAAPEVTPVGSDFQINTEASGSQFGADVAALRDDGFVVAWTTVAGYADFRGRRLDSSGHPIGLDFLLTSDPGVFIDGRPSLAPTADGGFAVA